MLFRIVYFSLHLECLFSDILQEPHDLVYGPCFFETWTITSCNTVVTNVKALLCTAGSDVLRELYSELTTMLDARVVAANMYQRNALTLRELQSIQSLRDRPIEAAETLLNIIMEQLDAVYLCFLDVLKHTEQQHIYRRLVQDGYKGILPFCVHVGTQKPKSRVWYCFNTQVSRLNFSLLNTT